jgi:hypothetical protein
MIAHCPRIENQIEHIGQFHPVDAFIVIGLTNHFGMYAKRITCLSSMTVRLQTLKPGSR